jgi:HEPN domain-containing protein
VASEVARPDLQRLADEKLADAKILLAAKSWSNAYYLAGYAVELALKACIAKRFKADTIPDKKVVDQTYRHDFRELVGTANLGPDFQTKQTDAAFVANWGVVSAWSPDARYQSSSEQSARNLIAAIEDSTDGVLEWTKAHW